MNTKVKEIIQNNEEQGILFVLKGFNTDEKCTQTLDSIINDKLGFMLSMRANSVNIILYDVFITLFDFLLAQYKKIIIIDNSKYIHLYPLYSQLSENVKLSLLNHYNEDIDIDTEITDISDYTAIFSNMKEIDSEIYCCYNFDEALLNNEKIEKISVIEADRKKLKPVSSLSDNYVNICVEDDYLHLINLLDKTNDSYVVSFSGYIIGADLILSYLEYLNSVYGGRIYTPALSVKKIDSKIHYDGVFDILEKYWGYKSFRTLKTYNIHELDNNNKKEIVAVSQEVIINDLISQVENCIERRSTKDVFVTAPTGAGKSLMFQIPAIYIGEKYGLLTLVITPLIGLMNDQVQSLKRKGYHGARTINSDISPIVKQEIIEDVIKGDCNILYLSPESLLSKSDIETLIGKRKIGMLIVDEAHIVTTWGKQFRPDYWYLGDHVQKLRTKQSKDIDNPMSFVIGTFTATAIYKGNEDMYYETINSLHMVDPITYLGYVRRDNISIEISEIEVIRNKTEYELNKFESIISTLNTAIMRNKKTLVYFPTVSLVRRFDDYCSTTKIKDYVATYHGQMEASEKDENFNAFLNGEKLVMLATKAFGMGIDIPDISIVSHFAPTGNVCDFMQEIGRAARDTSIQGQAVYKHMSNDFKHINKLHGLSAIKTYQLIEIIKKVLELYNAQLYSLDSKNKTTKKRNEMLVDAESFSYIFDGPMSDENNMINKVKTAMLLIQKDYENRGYAPFYMKPVSLFALGYLAISPLTQKLINDQYPGCVKVKKKDLNVCEINLKTIWEKSYNSEMSFPKFKYLLYSKSQELSFNKKYSFSSALSIEIHFEDKADYVFSKILNSIKDAINSSIMQNKYFRIKEIVDCVTQSSGLNKYKVESIINVFLAAIEVYKRDYSRKINSKMFQVHTLKDGSNTYLFDSSSLMFTKWIEKGFDTIKKNTIENFMYVVNEDDTNKTKEIITLLGVLESFGVLHFKSLGGSNSQIYIYVNETKTMHMVREKPYLYKNKLLETIDYRHKESVKMLTYLYQSSFSSDEIWDHLENYFLGILPDELKQN